MSQPLQTLKLLHAAAPAATDNPTALSDFHALGLSPQIISSLLAAGYQTPTPVQHRAIPAALAGRDLLVSSPTGSGKTAAFMLPAIERLTELTRRARDASNLSSPAGAPSERAQAARSGGRLSAEAGERHGYRQAPACPALLVLTPTRELAMQVTHAADTYGKHLRRLRTVSVLGGVPYRTQLMLLAKQPEIIVATPGRLLDHLERGRIDLSNLAMLVLDEADRMLDMGFIDDIETIVAATPATRQTLLFSATLDGKIGALTNRLLRNPERIEILRPPEQPVQITQSLHWVDDRAHKNRLLAHLLADHTLDQAIVFTATKRDADALATDLASAGFLSAALHGDLPQRKRTHTLKMLRERRVRVLVATDVAARGIDVPGITHVFNYDLPKFAEDYVHRIGRTGRAGRLGIAVSLAHHAEYQAVKRIERFTRQPLPVNTIAGFEPRHQPQPNERRARPSGRPTGGKRPAGKRPVNGRASTERFSSKGEGRAPGSSYSTHFNRPPRSGAAQRASRWKDN